MRESHAESVCVGMSATDTKNNITVDNSNEGVNLVLHFTCTCRFGGGVLLND